MLRALIIDDEEFARARLARLLQAHASVIEVVGQAAGATEALHLIRRLQPDLIFLDIQMPELSGFELLGKLESPPRVVFVTAYAAYAVDAFDRGAVDYLLKPVEEERLARTVQRLSRQNARETDLSGQLQVLATLLKQEKRVVNIPVRVGERFLFVPLAQVTHFEAEDKYVVLHTADGKSYLTEHTLVSLGEKLPANFLQVHRSIIINRDYLVDVAPLLGGRFAIRLGCRPPVQVTTGPTYNAAVKTLLSFQE